MIQPISHPSSPQPFSLPPSKIFEGSNKTTLPDEIPQIIVSLLCNKDRASASAACQKLHAAVSGCITTEYNQFLNKIKEINGRIKPENYLKIALCIQQVRALVNNMAPHSREAGLSVDRIRLLAKAGITSLGQFVQSVAKAYRKDFLATFPTQLSLTPSPLDPPLSQGITFDEELKKTWNQQFEVNCTSTTILAALIRGEETAFTSKHSHPLSGQYFGYGLHGTYLYVLLASGKGAKEIISLFSKIPGGCSSSEILEDCVEALLYRENMDDILAICHTLPLIDQNDIEVIKKTISRRVLDGLRGGIGTDPLHRSIAFKTIARVLWQKSKTRAIKELRESERRRDIAIANASKIPLNDLRSAMLRYMSQCLSEEGDTAKAAEVAAMIQDDRELGSPPTATHSLPNVIARAISREEWMFGWEPAGIDAGLRNKNPLIKSTAIIDVTMNLWKKRKNEAPRRRDYSKDLRDAAIENASKIPLNDLRSAVLRYMSLCLSQEGDTEKAAQVAAMIQQGRELDSPPTATHSLPAEVAKAISPEKLSFSQDDTFQILKKWFETQEPFKDAYIPLTNSEIKALQLVFTNCVLRMGSEKAIEQAQLLDTELKRTIAFMAIASCLCAKENVDAAIGAAQKILNNNDRMYTLYNMASGLERADKKDDAQKVLQMLPADKRKIDLNARQPWERDLEEDEFQFNPLNAQAARNDIISMCKQDGSSFRRIVNQFQHLARLEGFQHAFNVVRWTEFQEKLSPTDEYTDLPTDKEIMHMQDEDYQDMGVKGIAISSIQAGRFEEVLELYKQTGKPDRMASTVCKALLARGRVEEAKKMMKKNDSSEMRVLRRLFDQPISNPTHEDLQYLVETGNFCKAVNSDTQFLASRLAKAIAQTAPSSLPALPAPTEQKK